MTNSYAICGRVSGGWLWAAWDCEDNFWRDVESQIAPNRVGIATSKKDATQQIQSAVGEDVVMSSTSWRVRRVWEICRASLSDQDISKKPNEPRVNLPRVSSADAHSLHVEQCRFEVARELKAAIQSTNLNIAALQQIAEKTQLELNLLRGRLTLLKKQRAELREALRNLSSRLNAAELVRECELKELLRRNPDLLRFMIEGDELNGNSRTDD